MPESITIYRTTLPTGHLLTVRNGDLTEERVDAIVNAANSGLVHGGGVAGAILRKGGMVIQEESDRVGRVAIGSAAVTGAGALPARYVIHAVGPVWRANTEEENDRLLAGATTASLEIARSKGLDSIAFPAISSGIFGFPKERCAHVMVQALVDWAAGHPDDSPRDLRFVLVEDVTLSYFNGEMERRFGSSEPLV